MDDLMTAELRALRARAFGPGADIQNDPEALARWQDLEELARVPPESLAEPPIETVSRLDGVTEEVPQAPASAPQVDEPEAPVARSRMRWLLPVSLVVAVVLGAMSAAGVRAVTTAGDPVRQVGTLFPDEDFRAPSYLNADEGDVRGFESYHGLVVMATKGSWLQEGVEECVIVAVAGDVSNPSQGFEGPRFFGCGTGSFPGTVSFVVGEQFPRDLLAIHPSGTPLQFVLDGERVGVFAGGVESAPQQAALMGTAR